MAALAVMVLAVVGGVFRLDGGGPGAPAAAVSSPSPSAMGAPAAASPALRPSAAPTPSPTRPPTPTPTRPPTPTPTAPPTPTRAPSPTIRPTSTPQPSPTVPPITAGLVILEPADGEIVDERTVAVRGLGPPGATITLDIPFWFDEHTTADRRGRWSFSIDLVPGENEFTFRIGDDTQTSRTIRVVYKPD